jgi:hypothetical protein
MVSMTISTPASSNSASSVMAASIVNPECLEGSGGDGLSRYWIFSHPISIFLRAEKSSVFREIRAETWCWKVSTVFAFQRGDFFDARRQNIDKTLLVVTETHHVPSHSHLALSISTNPG